jgi:hypothetical protein
MAAGWREKKKKKKRKGKGKEKRPVSPLRPCSVISITYGLDGIRKNQEEL